MRTRDPKKETIVKKQAIHLIVQNGLKGFSMQKLADRCNISVATLYIYYKNKEDLIQQLGIEAATEYSNSTLKNFHGNLDFAEGIKIQWYNRLNFAIHHNTMLQFFEILKHSPYAHAVLNVAYKEFANVMTDFLDKAIREKKMRKISPELFWSMAFGPLYHLLQFHKDKKGFGHKPFEISEKMIDECIELVLQALKPIKV